VTLPTGTALGPYEILAPLGAGDEVYRARDTRLNRGVAIKVLPDSVARDPSISHGSSERRSCSPR